MGRSCIKTMYLTARYVHEDNYHTGLTKSLEQKYQSVQRNITLSAIVGEYHKNITPTPCFRATICLFLDKLSLAERSPSLSFRLKQLQYNLLPSGCCNG